VCIFAKQSISVVEICVPTEFSALEVTGIKLNHSGLTQHIFVVYRKPNADYSVLEKICNFVNHFALRPTPSVFVGDFNLPKIHWELNLASDSFHQRFLDCCVESNLCQKVLTATRGSNILDLILCSNEDLVQSVSQTEPFSTSDHDSLSFEISFPKLKPSATPRRDFSKTDWTSCLTYLSLISWPDEFSVCCNVEDFWNIFQFHLNYVIDQYVPFHKTNSPKKSKPVRTALILKRKCWKDFKNSNLNSRGDKYKMFQKAAANYRMAVTNFAKSCEQKLVKCRNDTKFFRFVNGQINSRNEVSPLVDARGILQTGEAEIADSLNAQFASVFVADNNFVPVFDNRNPNNLSQILFTEITVFEAFKQLKSKMGVGPDGFSAFFLKGILPAIIEPITSIFNVSFRTGSVPDIWRLATVCPIYKKGDRSKPENYRPVSITCVCSRVMESIIRCQLMKFLVEFQMISRNQFGFLAGRSTVTALLSSVNSWDKSKNLGFRTDVIYLDFSKAFDAVSYKKLLLKLRSYGITGSLFSWISAWLSNRSQRVKVGSVLSDVKPVLSGVPQGSVLGPLLFLLYINDAIDNIPPSIVCSMFADDIKISRAIDTAQSAIELQVALDKIVEWAEVWQMKLNSKKCAVLSIGKQFEFPYSISNDILPHSLSTLDLGVLIDSKLKFSLHCDKVYKSASCRSALILRCFKSRNKELLTKAFVTYVRPLLEYATEVFNPILGKDIQRLERVQRSFTKRIPGLKEFSYSQRLSFLHLESLAVRREKADLTMCFRILRGFSPLAYEEFFVFSNIVGHRGHNTKLQLPSVKSRKGSFPARVISKWNCLPQSLIDSQTVSIFKSRLDQHYLQMCRN